MLVLSCDVSEQLLLQGEHFLRRYVEAEARLGGLDSSARPVEELRPEPLLERADLEADRRLRYAEALGRLREALPLDHGAEGGKLTRIHKR